MSCFIVSEQLINDTLKFIHDNANPRASRDFLTWKRTHELMKLAKFSDALNEFGKVILRENIKSFNHRYPKHAENIEEYLSKVVIDYRSGKPIYFGQFLKNLDCINYQSCETENYYHDKNSLFYDLEALRKWSSRLVEGYESAEWGY